MDTEIQMTGGYQWKINQFFWNNEWYHRATFWHAPGRSSSVTKLSQQEAVAWIESMRKGAKR